jgi:hypothetical protein
MSGIQPWVNLESLLPSINLSFSIYKMMEIIALPYLYEEWTPW